VSKIFPILEPQGEAPSLPEPEPAEKTPVTPESAALALSEPVIKRLTLSRHLFEMALRNARQQQEAADAAAVNLLQDAVEIFFLAAFDFLNIAVAQRTEFNQYLDKLSDAVGGDLPFRRRLMEINRVRVHSKHEGIPPNRKEVDGYIADGRKFLEQICEKVLHVDYWTISLVALLDEGEPKQFLQAAENAFKEGKYVECLVECRKAFFVSFESAYDTQKDLRADGGILFGSQAPYYARDKDYIKKNVKEHFDYIVLDHKNIDSDLMKEGIDNTAFWNVWRLTPQVYRYQKEDPWIIQHHPAKQAAEGLSERAAHVLSSMTSMLLTRQDSRRMAKYINNSSYFDLKVKAGTTIYLKADKNGDKAGVLPPGVEVIGADYATQGLNDEEIYWSAFYFAKGPPMIMLSGYVLQDDLIFE
jgi:hypothetical protein